PWGGPAAIATVLRRRQHKGMVSDAFPGRFVEVGGTASVDRARRVPVADLVVRPGPDGPSLHGPTGPLVLYTGEDDHPHLRAFAPPHVEALPVRIADHRPRVQVGDLVVARRRWWLTADPAPAVDQDRAVAEVCRLRGRTGIPRHVFVRLPGEPKPVYLDLTSPTACSLLARRPEGTVVVEEMLPGPDQLWLRRRAGAFTSEFRIAMTRKEPG
ncbi:lantibiotic dehydratase, partial [Actinosynnema sp. NPDC059797]